MKRLGDFGVVKEPDFVVAVAVAAGSVVVVDVVVAS